MNTTGGQNTTSKVSHDRSIPYRASARPDSNPQEQVIYIAAYSHRTMRLLSMSAVEHGSHWERIAGTTKVVLGPDFFYIGNNIGKHRADVFRTINEAVDSLVKEAEAEIAALQRKVQRIYQQIALAKNLETELPCGASYGKLTQKQGAKPQTEGA